MRSPLRTLIAAAAILTTVAACKKAPPPPAPEAQQPAPPPPAPVAVGAVELGRAIDAAKKVAAPLATFGLRDTIYASVATTGAAASATLSAKWTFQTGQVVDTATVAIAPTGPAQTEFHITKKSAWPVGKYKVAILLNGQPAGEKEFDVKK